MADCVPLLVLILSVELQAGRPGQIFRTEMRMEEGDLMKQIILRNCNDIARVKYKTLIIVRVATFKSMLYIQSQIS